MAKTKRPKSSPDNELAAIKFAASNIELVMADLLLRTGSEDRAALLKCFLKKIEVFMADLMTCGHGHEVEGGGSQGPDCPPGWLEVGDFCIPPKPGGGS